MVIVRFQGGVGNQLFQYALYRKLLSIGKEVYADLNDYRYQSEARKYELDKLGLSVREASLETINRIFPRGNDIISKILRNTFYKKKCIKEKIPQAFNPIFLESDNVFLSGYWQTEKYFEDICEEIYHDINFRLVNRHENQEVLEKIHCQNSISVHIRFGDYINNPLYSGICTKDYYLNAIDIMRNRVENATFFIISDDIPRAGELLEDKRFEYIRINKSEAAYYDLYLISQCRHHIMANSSFSWWGTWLDRRENKIVISPSIWQHGAVSEDIWKKEWIKISPSGEIL